MAYLLGYRMERDTGHAIKLLKESAAAHDKFALDAAEQLAKIYEQGLLGSFSVDYNEALSWRQRAISINKRIYGKKHPHTAKAYNNIGKVLYNLGNYKEALRYYNRSYRINKKAFGLNHLSIAENYNNIGEVYIKLNKILGISVLYDALKIYQDEYGEDNLVVADTLVNIGRIDNENEFFRNLNKSLIALADIVNGKIDELSDGGINKSFVRFQKALEIYHKTYGEYHYSVAAAYTYLGRLYILHEKYTEALENLFKSLSIFEKIYGQNHPFIVFPLINIALAYSHLNENNKAIDYFSKALSLEKKFSIENQPALKQLYREIGELYLRLNNYSEALKYFVEDVENLAADYDADEENKKQERKYYNNKKGFNRFLKITSKFKNKFLYVFSLIFFGIIFMLIALPKGIVGIVKLIVSFKGFGKKIKKNSGKNGQFGSTVYSSFNYLDSQTMFYSMLVNIRDKYIQIGDICCMANEYNAALDYYNKALDIFKRMNDEEERVSANITLYYDMGSAYFHLGNIDRALFFCGKAFEFKKFPFGRVGEAKDDAETAKLYNIIGEIYFRTNQFEKALEQFHKTVTVYEKLNSDEDGNNHQELALAYNNSGKTHAALEKPEKATEFYSKAVSEYKHLAVTCRNRRKYDEALEWYLKVADLYVLSPGGESEEMGGICNQIGGLYYIRHNYDKSLEWYTKALEICKQIFGGKHSNTAHVLQNIADVFLAQGSDTTALEWLEKSLDIRQEVFAARQQAAMTTGNDADCLETFRIDPKYAGAYYNRGNRYYDKKDYDLAIADFSEALRINPNSAESYTCRGNAYGNGKKDYDQAIADYNEALRIRPNYAWAYNCRGYAYSNKKDYDRAVADYNEAIRLKPDYILAYNNRGLVYMSKGDYDSAITNYTELLRFDPNNTAAYKYRAYAYNGKGDHDRAIVDYTEALRLGPDNAVIYNSRGWSYYLKGDYKRALEDANKSLSIRPDDTNTLDTRANAYYGLGDFDSAIADWEAALKLDPDNAGIRESLEKARADKAGY
jgi:tetratricopeptide (TPR) repeat protein